MRSPTAQSANLTNAQQSLLTNYNQSSTGLRFRPARRCASCSGARAWRASVFRTRCRKSGITTFNDNTRNVFQTLAFRSGIAGQNQLSGIITSMVTPSFSFSTLDRARGTAQRQGLQRRVPGRGRGRQHEVLRADGELPPVLPDEGPARSTAKATTSWATACSSRTLPASAARWRRRSAVSMAAAKTMSAASTSARRRRTRSSRRG